MNKPRAAGTVLLFVLGSAFIAVPAGVGGWPSYLLAWACVLGVMVAVFLLTGWIVVGRWAPWRDSE